MRKFCKINLHANYNTAAHNLHKSGKISNIHFSPKFLPKLGICYYIRVLFSKCQLYTHVQMFPLITDLWCRGAPDPECCYPSGSWHVRSGSETDRSHLDPARSSRIRIQTLTTADNRRKITLSAPQLEKMEWLFTLFCDWTFTWVIISVWH